jgi:hypothetical protein
MSASERRIAELEEELHRVQHLLKLQMRTVENLEVGAIVNRDGVPKVDLRWDQLAAQITPESARDLALDIIRVAGWAEQDATTFRLLKADLGERAAGGFMAAMRRSGGV